MTENNDWTLNFYYTEEIKFGTKQNEGNSQEATETFFDKPKSQAQQRGAMGLSNDWFINRKWK